MRGATGPMGPTGPQGDQGPPGEPAPVMTSAHMLACNGNAADGLAIPLSSDHIMNGFTPNANNTEFTANVPGTYLISYRVSYTEPIELMIWVYASNRLITASSIFAETDQFYTTFIHTLEEGDVLSIRRSALPRDVSLINGVCAYLCAVKID